MGILVDLMEKCSENVSVDSTYEQLLCTLVDLLNKPFLKTKVSDEHNYLAHVSDSIARLGALTLTSSDKVCFRELSKYNFLFIFVNTLILCYVCMCGCVCLFAFGVGDGAAVSHFLAL